MDDTIWEDLVDSFPGLESRPAQVRPWFQKLLDRRQIFGADERAFVEKVAWTGQELRSIEAWELTHDLAEWGCDEPLAKLLAKDVTNILDDPEVGSQSF